MSQQTRGGGDVEGCAGALDGRPGGAGSPFRGRSGLVVILLVLVTSAAVYEARTSRWQAWYFSRVASTFGFVVPRRVAPLPSFAADTVPVRDPGTNPAVEPLTEQLVTRTEVPPP